MPEFYAVFPRSVCLLALLSLKSCLHQSLHYILIAYYYCYLAENKCETPKTCFHLSHGKGNSMIRKIAIKTEIQKRVDFPEVCISDTLCDFSRVDLFPSLLFVNFSSVFFLIPCLFCITSAFSLAVLSVHFSVQCYK